MTKNHVMNFWLIRAEQRRRIVKDKKSKMSFPFFIPSIYAQDEVDEICDKADEAFSDYKI